MQSLIVLPTARSAVYVSSSRTYRPPGNAVDKSRRTITATIATAATPTT
jgi:hypothetical protein